MKGKWDLGYEPENEGTVTQRQRFFSHTPGTKELSSLTSGLVCQVESLSLLPSASAYQPLMDYSSFIPSSCSTVGQIIIIILVMNYKQKFMSKYLILNSVVMQVRYFSKSVWYAK